MEPCLIILLQGDILFYLLYYKGAAAATACWRVTLLIAIYLRLEFYSKLWRKSCDKCKEKYKSRVE
jgi:hypothetical protein